MTARSFQLRRMTLQMGAAAFLTACGSGDGPAPAPTATPAPAPPSAYPGPVLPAGLTLIAGDIGSMVSADGTGLDARFTLITDGVVDSMGTMYLEERDLGMNTDTFRPGFVIRAVTPGAVVRTLLSRPAPDGVEEMRGLRLEQDQLRVHTSVATYLFTREGTLHSTGPVSEPVPRPDRTDGDGNVYWFRDGIVWKKSAAGNVTQLAGSAGSKGQAVDGRGSDARFDQFQNMTLHDGRLVVIDKMNIRTVSLDGEVGSTATTLPAIPTIFLPQQANLLSNGSGTLYVIHASAISRLGADGTLTPFAGRDDLSARSVDGVGAAARLRMPAFLAADPAGNLYAVERPGIGVADFPYTQAGVALRKIAPDGTVTSTFHPGGLATGMAADKSGNVFVSTDHFGDGGLTGVAGGRVILKLAADGRWSVFAGRDGGPDSKIDGSGAQASFGRPRILGFDNSGNLYVEDGAVYRRITPDALVTTVNGVPGIVGEVYDDAGNSYDVDTAHSTIVKYTPDDIASIVAGKRDHPVTVLGALPGKVEHPRSLVRIGINSFAFISGNAILRLALP
ncbi:hypothetical protein RBA41_04725 [Massilia sp. CCM 9210]|uniref:hypothetical protein n=1 Tax=Massilia scottii TaxID=3057166 RepID=UPI002796C94B|nr:hypothetical protein [Massilia sp. CCM 9210]MDQ1812603.1 hypothetical protein [Massilia sp. CCM 9210]